MTRFNEWTGFNNTARRGPRHKSWGSRRQEERSQEGSGSRGSLAHQEKPTRALFALGRLRPAESEVASLSRTALWLFQMRRLVPLLLVLVYSAAQEPEGESTSASEPVPQPDPQPDPQPSPFSGEPRASPVKLGGQPGKKTWWTKRVDGEVYAAGELTARHIKYAWEEGFRSLVFLSTSATDDAAQQPQQTQPAPAGTPVPTPVPTEADFDVRRSGHAGSPQRTAREVGLDVETLRIASPPSLDDVASLRRVLDSAPRPVLVAGHTGSTAMLLIALASDFDLQQLLSLERLTGHTWSADGSLRPVMAPLPANGGCQLPPIVASKTETERRLSAFWPAKHIGDGLAGITFFFSRR